jgi:cell division protein FtsZ
VTDLIVMPGLINLDFADIKSVISEMGKAMMGTGEAEGEERALKAADMAISNPLLDDVSMKGARGVLINITGGPDLMLFEVEQAANRIRAEVDPDANIIFGNTILDDMEGRIRVSVVATGIDVVEEKLPEKVQPLRSHLKPIFTKPDIRDSRFEHRPEPKPEVRMAAQIHPVHRQRETIAEEMGAQSMPQTRVPVSEAEALILSDEVDDMRTTEEKYPVTVTVRPIPQQRPDLGHSPLRGEPEHERRLFGFLGRRKSDMRVEPQPLAQRQPAPQRASAPPMPRPQAETSRTQTDATSQADDLFPDHKRDDQFEIPAFLRRQTN